MVISALSFLVLAAVVSLVFMGLVRRAEKNSDEDSE
jgi:hypothetical protein